MTLEQLGWLVTTGIAIAGFALALRKSKPDILNMNAKTSQIFQTMLQDEVEKGIAKDKTILGMEIRIDTLEKEYEKVCVENENLKDWCKRLVKQILDAGKTPVDMHSHNRGAPK